MEHSVPNLLEFSRLAGDSRFMLLDAASATQFLHEELSRRMKVNSRYSLRAFARHLGMSPGELSEVLKGKRSLSLRSALRVAKALSLNESESRHLLFISQAEKTGKIDEKRKKAVPTEVPADRRLTVDMFHIVSEWYCFAIVNLADCAGFKADPAWIAQRLGITRFQAELALERLSRVGLLERRGDRIEVAKDYVIAPSGIPSEAIRDHHRQILAKASEALDFQQIAEREISGAGLAFDPKDLPKIKREISDFQDRMVKRFSKGKKTEVYQLEVAFFRLSRKNEEKNHEN